MNQYYTIGQLAKLAGCSEREAKDAIAYWTEKGILCGVGEAAVAVMSPQ